jgi:hypothetical protein
MAFRLFFGSTFDTDERFLGIGGGPASGQKPAAGDSVSMQAVLERISKIAALSPTELSAAMSTEQGSEIARFESEPVEPEGLLRPWNSIGRASPLALSEPQYERFLAGEHPIAGTSGLYGGHLK